MIRTSFVRAISVVMLVFAMTAGTESNGLAQDQRALAIFSDAANFQNNGAFGLAAKEWEKFLKQFPNHELAGKAEHYKGVCYLQLKDYEKAAAAFDTVVKNHPQVPVIEDAYLNLGWSQYSLKQYAAADKTFAEMVKKFPEGKYVDQALYFQAESLYNLDKKQEAVAAYDALVKNHPKSGLRRDGVYALGVTLEELGDYAKAGEAYDIFLAEFANDPLATEVKMRKAETILQAGDFAKAETMFGEVSGVEGFTSADHAIFRQAYCAAKLDKFKEAGDLYAKIPATYKESVYVNDAAMSAGRSYYRAKDYENAAKWLQQSVDADTSDSPEAAHWLSRIYLQNKEAQKVVDLLAKVLPKAAESSYLVNLKMDQADALYELPEWRDESVAKYLAIYMEHPDDALAATALYNAAFAALELKKYDEGLKHAETYLAKYADAPLTPDVKYIAAECSLQLGKLTEAEAIYKDLTSNYPKHAELDQWWTRLGLSLYLQKKYGDVVATLSPVVDKIKSPASQSEAQFLIGASQFHEEQFGEAATALTAALQANSKWRQADETLLYLSRANQKLNKLDEAIKNVKKMLADFPDSIHTSHAHYRYGEYCDASGDYETAVQQYEAVIAGGDSPFVPYAHYKKGWSQMMKKDYPAATASFTALITGFPDHPLLADSQFARAMCYRQDGKLGEAIDDVKAFLATEPAEPQKSSALYEQGLAEVALGRQADAIKTFTSIMTANPEYASADKVLYELAWAYKSSDKNGEAVKTFAQLAADHGDSKLAAEANFHVAESLYDKKEFEDAVKSYTIAKQKAEQAELGEKSRYKLGWAHFQLKQYEPALAQFSEQVEMYPEGKLVADGKFMKAETLFRMENYAESLPVFTAVKADEVSSPRIKELILLHGGQSASQEGMWAEALTFLTELPEKFPDSPYVAEANYEIGWAQQNLKKPEEALKNYELAATLSRGEVGARARFMMGEVQFEAKKFDVAIEQFLRCMFGYGGEQAPDEVKNWQAQSGFEAGRCSEVQIAGAEGAAKAKFTADAKKYYNYVVEKHPNHNLVEQAKKRLAALK